MAFPWAAAISPAALGGYLYRKNRKDRARKLARQKKAEKEARKREKGKFYQKDALSKQQKKLLKKMSKGALKDLKKLTPLHKIPTSEKSDIFKKARGVISDILSPDSKAAEKFEAPIRKQFKEQTLPEIAERFGGVGAERSSAMENVLGQAGTDFDTSLGALRSGLQMQAVPMAANLAQIPLQEQLALRQSAMGQSQQALGTSPFNTVFQPPTFSQPAARSSGGGGFFSSLMPVIGSAAGAALGGPVGTAIGAAAGRMIGGGGGGGVRQQEIERIPLRS